MSEDTKEGAYVFNELFHRVAICTRQSRELWGSRVLENVAAGARSQLHKSRFKVTDMPLRKIVVLARERDQVVPEILSTYVGAYTLRYDFGFADVNDFSSCFFVNPKEKIDAWTASLRPIFKVREPGAWA
jgi:hypothetical protein